MEFGSFKTKSVVAAFIAVLALFPLVSLANAQEKPAKKAEFINKNASGVAIKGYDTVAYFQSGKAVKGLPEFQQEWNGAKWYFSSQANRDLFAASPEKYAPQYGGYCAYAVSENYTYDADPEIWKLVDGKLYLNYNSQAQGLWNQDIPGRVKKGDANWPGLHQ